jgi:hypothetical protein
MRRTTEWGRYLRQTAMNATRNLQDLFGAAETAIYTRPDPTPQREDGLSGGGTRRRHSRANGGADRLPPRERRGRD